MKVINSEPKQIFVSGHRNPDIDSIAGATGEGFATSTLPRLNVLLQELTSTSRQLSDLLDEIDNSPQLLILGREAGFRTRPAH